MKTVILILVCFVLSFPVFAAEPAGYLIISSGNVKIRRAGVDELHREIDLKIPVLKLDEIQTGANSKATIFLSTTEDNIELSSQSFFKISDVSAESSEIAMSIGKARFKIKKGLKPLKPGLRRFRVRTANAIIGVKGTEFVIGTGAEVTNILTLEGSVDVASSAAPDVQVEVSENQVSQVKQSSTPTAPVTVPPAVRDNIVNTDSPAAFNNVQFGTAVPSSTEKQESKKKEEKKSGSDTKKDSGSGSSSQSSSQSGTSTSSSSTTGGSASGTTATGSSNTDDSSASETPSQETTLTDQTVPQDDGLSDVLGNDDTPLDLALIDDEEMAEIDDIEPVEIDPEDLFDADAITEEVEETTNEIIEEVVDEVIETVNEATDKTVTIQIDYQ